MKYNFDAIQERLGSDSLKWSKSYMQGAFGDGELLPLWIADMDFKTAQPIIDAISQRVNQGIFGYGMVDERFLEACVGWQKRRNSWNISQEEILFSPGIIPALNFMMETFCRPGDKVVIQSPVYYPFRHIIRDNGCQVANNQLIYENGRYSMDYHQLETLCKDSRTKMMILCSPHNPVGRVWSREELQKVGEICLRNDVLVVSDEIHGDLIYEGSKHIPFASIHESFAMNSIICTAPTKTFNLAGVQCSDIIVKNPRLRRDLNHKLLSVDITPTSFAYVAQIAAYTQGEEWLTQLLAYLAENVALIDSFVAANYPGVKFIKPEGTYLAWLDFREVEKDPKKLETLMRKKAKVALDEGYIFGSGGEGFERINFACPKSRLQEALERIQMVF